MEKPSGAPPRDYSRSEKEKLRDLTFKKKLEYIFEYYRYHIIAGVLALIAIAGVLNTYIFNPRPDTALLIAWNTGFAFEDQLSELADVMTDRLIDEDVNEIVEATLFLSGADDPTMEMANIQRLIAMIAAGVIDVLVVDSELLVEFAISGMIQPMESILAIIERNDPEIYSRIEEKLTYVQYETEDGIIIEHIMGVDISDNALLDEIGFIAFERYFSVSGSSRQLENVADALIVLFE